MRSAWAMLLLVPALFLPGRGAADASSRFEKRFREGMPLDGSLWLLWNCSSRRMAMLDLKTGRLEERIGSYATLTCPPEVAVRRRKDGPPQVYALGETQAGGAVLYRGTLGDFHLEPQAEMPDAPGPSFPHLRPLPHGEAALFRKTGRGWEARAIDAPASDPPLLGPLAEMPVAIAPFGPGRWLILDAHRAWAWPDGTTLLWDDQNAPEQWRSPPPLIPYTFWPTSVLAWKDGILLFGNTFDGIFALRPAKIDRSTTPSGQGLAHLQRFDRVNRPGEGLRYPGGPARSAALQFPGTLYAMGDGIAEFFELGGQRVMELHREKGVWVLRTLWTAAADPGGPASMERLHRELEREPDQYWIFDFQSALDQTAQFARLPAGAVTPYLKHYLQESWRWYGAHVLAWNVLDRLGEAPPLRPEEHPSPATVQAIMQRWTADPDRDWLHYAETTVARFLMDHAEEMAVLEAHRAEAVPRLLEIRSPEAAFALAILQAREADGWFRHLVEDPTTYDWEGGSTVPVAEIGQTVLEHLHGKPLRELMTLSPAQVRSLRKRARSKDRFGPAVHARFLLENLGRTRE